MCYKNTNRVSGTRFVGEAGGDKGSLSSEEEAADVVSKSAAVGSVLSLIVDGAVPAADEPGVRSNPNSRLQVIFFIVACMICD